MRRLMLGAAFCLLLPLTGCTGGPSTEPPPEINQACVSTGFGTGVLYAPEWVKPMGGATSAITWERLENGRIIFRSDTTNPLNGDFKRVWRPCGPKAY